MMLAMELLILFLIVPCVCIERQLVWVIDFVLETLLDSCLCCAFVDCLGFLMEAIKSSTNIILLLSQAVGTLPQPLLAVCIKPEEAVSQRRRSRAFLGPSWP